jgi:transcriptional regulator with XRE-family HTH domain
MTAFDLYDFPVRQDDPTMWGQSGWLSSPPPIVQIVEDPWNHRDLNDAYGWMLEITLDEADAGTLIERYASANGSVVAIDLHTSDLADGNSLAEKLDRIKSHLGIGMKHLAAALGVERPTVYAWVKGTRAPQPKRWDRIQSLLELADHWQELSSHPLSRRIFVPTESGQSVMDLLSAETLDAPKIKEVLKSLAIDENDRSARLRGKAVAMRERMKAKGVKPLPAEVVEQTMRNLSRW